MAHINKLLSMRQNNMVPFKLIEEKTLELMCSKMDIANIHKVGDDKIKSLDIHPIGSHLLMGTKAGSVRLYDITESATNKIRCVSEHNPPQREGQSVSTFWTNINNYNSVETIQWAKLTPDIFATGGLKKTIDLWDANRMECIESMSFANDIIHQIEFSLSHPSVAAVTIRNEPFAVLDIRLGSRTSPTQVPRAVSCAWSPKTDNLLAVGTRQKKKVTLFDIRWLKSSIIDLTIPGVEDGHEVSGVSFSEDGLHLVATCSSFLTCWHGTSFKRLINIEGLFLNDQPSPLSLLVPSCGSRHLICLMPSKGGIKSIDLKSRQVLRTMQGHFGPVPCLAYNKYYMELYSGGNDGFLILWSGVSGNMPKQSWMRL